jgi:hypothetical protein
MWFFLFNPLLIHHSFLMSLVFDQIAPSFFTFLRLVEELINISFTSLRSLSSLVLGILSCKISQHSSFLFIGWLDDLLDNLLDDLLDNLLDILLWDILLLFIHRRFGHWYLLGWHIFFGLKSLFDGFFAFYYFDSLIALFTHVDV